MWLKPVFLSKEYRYFGTGFIKPSDREKETEKESSIQRAIEKEKKRQRHT